MGERASKKKLDNLKVKNGVDVLYSWSRYQTYKTDPYGYLLKYILKEKETRKSIYGVAGGHAHDILERYYTKQIGFDDMINEYNVKLSEMYAEGLKYNRNNEEKNTAIAIKYEDNMKLFFLNHTPIKGKVVCEQFVTIKIGENVFIGYIDFIHKDNNDYVITDFKTSTIYTGKKAIKESGQLVLYAESLIQKGIPLESIRIGWNFLKYVTVEQTLFTKDKETKELKKSSKNTLRTEMVAGVESNLRKWLEKEGYDELQIEDMVQTAIENNSFDTLPENIKCKYKVSDCIVEVKLNKELIDDLKHDIIKTIEEVKIKQREYVETEDDKLFWTEIDSKNEYFFNNLCGYSASQHRPYKEYLDNINMFAKKDKPNNINKKVDDDLSWLNDL